MKEKKTLVIGASANPERYSNKAIRLLQSLKVPHIAFGLKEVHINETVVNTKQEAYKEIDTITLYVGPKRQDKLLLDYIISLSPRRVIFNPGTEDLESIQRIKSAGIETEIACTLVLLRTGQY